MGRLVSVEQFDRLFGDVQRSAWRWEAQGVYREPSESEPFDSWRRGEPDDLAWLSGWLDEIRAAAAAGKWFGRVRMLTDPLTEYLRWELEVTPHNVEAGEDIRVISVGEARRVGLPEYDFWLFDDLTVARMHFGDTGMSGAEISTAPDTVARHRTWRDLAQEHSAPFDDYVRLTKRST